MKNAKTELERSLVDLKRNQKSLEDRVKSLEKQRKSLTDTVNRQRAEVSDSASKKHAELASQQVLRSSQREAADALQTLHSVLEAPDRNVDSLTDALDAVISVASGSALTPTYQSPWPPGGVKQQLHAVLEAHVEKYAEGLVQVQAQTQDEPDEHAGESEAAENGGRGEEGG